MSVRFLSRLLTCGAVSLLASTLLAVETRFWIQNDPVDFQKGTLKGLSVRSDGRLLLAPVMRELFDPSTPYLWAVAEDSRGTLYVGGGGTGGNNARLQAIDASGKGRVVTEVEGLEIHAIAVNAKDEVFVATSPDSKIYRIVNNKPVLFYDPKVKYVWAMAFNKQGDLFLATGDQGDIHRVTAAGQGSVFFRTDETHARSLVVDGQDNLIVGTEPGGLVMRISPRAEGFVLYQAPKREVTAVAVAPDGSIYAAAIGNKAAGTGAGPTIIPLAPAPSASPAATSTAPPTSAAGRPAAPPPSSLVVGGPSIPGGSELYRIDRDGAPRRVWTQSQDVVYAIAFDGSGRPLLATGNKGNIYRVDSPTLHTMLETALPMQITNLLAGRQGRLIAVTGNIGKVYQIGPELEKQGTLDSDSFDAGSFAYWGRVRLRTENNGGRVSVETRSGNLERTQKNWSPWAPVPLTADGGRTSSPASRFSQYRLTLSPSAGGDSPVVSEVEMAYQAKNVAPVVERVETTPANYRFPAQTLTLTPSTTLTLPPVGQRRTSSPLLSSDTGVTMQYAKGYLGARWSASDENSDALLYTVEIRGVQESAYKPLQDKVQQKQVSFDSTAFPDGEYRVRVTASDLPDNVPTEAMTAQAESEPFLIDNTPPVLSAITATAAGNRLVVKWSAKDALSVIEKAEYSLNGGPWLPVQPTTRLFDAREQDYSLELDRAGASEQTVAVRVTDEYDNQAVGKAVVK